MSDPTDLNVEVANNELVVIHPETGDRVTYRKDGYSPVLVATDPMRGDPDPARVKFLASAWKVAHATAKELGWLKW